MKTRDQLIQTLRESGETLEECQAAVASIVTHLMIERFLEETTLEEITQLWKTVHEDKRNA